MYQNTDDRRWILQGILLRTVSCECSSHSGLLGILIRGGGDSLGVPTAYWLESWSYQNREVAGDRLRRADPEAGPPPIHG